jgi:hypothetical protein
MELAETLSMIHSDIKKDQQPRPEPPGAEPSDDDSDALTPKRKIVLGELKTDEEERLAAEIEKLRR